MNKLSKDQQQTHTALAARLANAKDELEAAFNVYNGVLGELRDFRDGLVSDMDSYFSDRSEKWQEGDKGQQYETWKQAWEDLELEDLEELELEHGDNFEQAPMDPESA